MVIDGRIHLVKLYERLAYIPKVLIERKEVSYVVI